MSGVDGGPATARSEAFTPPVGYRLCEFDDMGSLGDKELWVLRVPEGVDAACLDGVTFPVEALGSESGALAEVQVPGGDMYDVLYAAQTTAERVNEGPSQLIEMAGPSQDRVRLHRLFLRTPESAGVASELMSMSALVPRKGSLRLAPITRRLYMARQAPRARTNERPKSSAPARKQPWDRLTGSQSATPATAQRPASSEKKRKKDGKDESKKKKQKKVVE